MGWERRSGGLYYYRKVRDGEQVRSEYVGTGVTAQLAALLDAERRQEREWERERWREEKERFLAIDRELARREDDIRARVRGVLLAYGYHAHRRQWRKRRHGRQRGAEKVP